eukprot:Rhum_TRINITY_DN15354_c10_g1::Rhum_TRINITY_DN15354_c10_g1_i1::g.154093::m.154093
MAKEQVGRAVEHKKRSRDDAAATLLLLLLQLLLQGFELGLLLHLRFLQLLGAFCLFELDFVFTLLPLLRVLQLDELLLPLKTHFFLDGLPPQLRALHLLLRHSPLALQLHQLQLQRSRLRLRLLRRLLRLRRRPRRLRRRPVRRRHPPPHGHRLLQRLPPRRARRVEGGPPRSLLLLQRRHARAVLVALPQLLSAPRLCLPIVALLRLAGHRSRLVVAVAPPPRLPQPLLHGAALRTHRVRLPAHLDLCAAHGFDGVFGCGHGGLQLLQHGGTLALAAPTRLQTLFQLIQQLLQVLHRGIKLV